MSAVSHAEHVSSFVHHNMARIVQKLAAVISQARVNHLGDIQTRISECLEGIREMAMNILRIKSEETEDTCARFVHSPTETVDPVLSRIKILHCDCKHTVCVVRNESIEFIRLNY